MKLALAGRRHAVGRDDAARRGVQPALAEFPVAFAVAHPAVAQLAHHLGADAPFVFASRILLREQHRHCGRQVLQMNQIGGRDRETRTWPAPSAPRREPRRPAPVRARAHVQHAGDRAPPIRDLGRDGLAQIVRRRFGSIERDRAGGRVEHRDAGRTDRVPAGPSTLAGPGLDHRLPDHVVDAFGHRDAAAARGIGDGASDRGEADRVGHDHDREAEGVGEVERRRGELGGGGVQPDHHAAHAVLGNRRGSMPSGRAADSGRVWPFFISSSPPARYDHGSSRSEVCAQVTGVSRPAAPPFNVSRRCGVSSRSRRGSHRSPFDKFTRPQCAATWSSWPAATKSRSPYAKPLRSDTSLQP